MEIKTIKNYKDMANKFKEITKCDDVKIRILTDNHFHFGMIKDGISVAVICYDDGTLSVAPFVNVEESLTSDAWLNVNKLPIFDDFVILMNALKELVVEPIL